MIRDFGFECIQTNLNMMDVRAVDPHLDLAELPVVAAVARRVGEDVVEAHVLLHPRGVKFTSTDVAGKSPTEAELADAGNWDRVFERKLIRLAALDVN